MGPTELTFPVMQNQSLMFAVSQFTILGYYFLVYWGAAN